MFFLVIELTVAFVVVLLIGTQVIIPLWNNAPLFPMFGRKASIVNQMGKAVDKMEADELEKDLTKLQKGKRL